MYKIIQTPDIEIRDTKTKKGRGVYACRDFKNNEIIEISPYIVLEDHFSLIPDCLQEIVYNGSGFKKLSRKAEKEGKQVLAIVLGYGSMYNHGNPANVSAKPNPKTRIMEYKSLRKITKGTELLINYDALWTGVSKGNKWIAQRKLKYIKP